MDRAKPFDIPKREVWGAYKRVRANQGAAGVDGQSIVDFEADLSNNPLQAVESTGVRQLLSAAGATGGHTEGRWSNPAAGDTHGRRPHRPDGRQTILGATRGTTLPRRLLRVSTRQVGARCSRRGAAACWRYDWVLDLDIKSFFDDIDRELLKRAVRKHTDCPWVLLYLERWLRHPFRWRMAASSRGQEERHKAGSSLPSWRISFSITRLTCGCVGAIPASPSRAMPMMRYATAAVRRRRGRCAHRLRGGLSNGFELGPRIGIQSGPLSGVGTGLSR